VPARTTKSDQVTIQYVHKIIAVKFWPQRVGVSFYWGTL